MHFSIRVFFWPGVAPPPPLPRRPSPKARRSSRKKVNDPRPPPLLFFETTTTVSAHPRFTKTRTILSFLLIVLCGYIRDRFVLSLFLLLCPASLVLLFALSPRSSNYHDSKLRRRRRRRETHFPLSLTQRHFFPRWKDLHSSDARRRRRRRMARGKNRRTPAKRNGKKECSKNMGHPSPIL